jgi:cell volume regulation protein A
MLTVGALELINRTPAPGEWIAFAGIQLIGGVVIGVVVALLGCEVLNRIRLGSAGLYPVLATSVAGLAYGLAAYVGASGFLAVYVAGLLVGARVPRHRRSIRTFHDGIAAAAGIGLFLLLGLLVFPSDLPPVALPALAVTAVLVFLARPIAVALCLAPLGYRWRDLVLLSWAGLRGAVPIVLATFPLAAGLPQGNLIFDVVFFTVLVSAALQGVTVGWLARRLGLAGFAVVHDGDTLLVLMPERLDATEMLVAWARGEQIPATAGEELEVIDADAQPSPDAATPAER